MKFYASALLTLLSLSAFSQANSSQQANEIQELKKQLSDLNEIVEENSRLIKAQLKDLHSDQMSRGYIELKYGLSKLNIVDLEDLNDDLFSDVEGSEWDHFDYGKIIDLEFGKSIYINNNFRHEFGVGFQQLKSKTVSASFMPSSGSKIKVFETVTAQTIFLRYTALFTPENVKRLSFGPGITIGYSPETKALFQLEQGDKGVQIRGESYSYLFEMFGKAKFEFTRYFSFVSMIGYRIQQANDIRATAADLVNVKSKIDLDLSGAFATVGIAASF